MSNHTDAVEAEPGPSRNLPFMILMAMAVGAVAGVGAWAFRMLIGLIHNTLFLGQFNVNYDANVFTPASPWGIGIVLENDLNPTGVQALAIPTVSP